MVRVLRPEEMQLTFAMLVSEWLKLRSNDVRIGFEEATEFLLNRGCPQRIEKCEIPCRTPTASVPAIAHHRCQRCASRLSAALKQAQRAGKSDVPCNRFRRRIRKVGGFHLVERVDHFRTR